MSYEGKNRLKRVTYPAIVLGAAALAALFVSKAHSHKVAVAELDSSVLPIGRAAFNEVSRSKWSSPGPTLPIYADVPPQMGSTTSTSRALANKKPVVTTTTSAVRRQGVTRATPLAPKATALSTTTLAPLGDQGRVQADSVPSEQTIPVSMGISAGQICIRNRESRGNYNANTGNGYYGAYQYDNSTWDHYSGYARADLAPPAIQDEKALLDYNLGPAHRHREWPNTSRICGV